MVDTKDCKEVEKTMPIEIVQMPKYKCSRCGYEWFPEDPKNIPVKCAGCNSPYWNKERKHGKKIGNDKS